jgi:membrane-associated phospholipid phosphatase
VRRLAPLSLALLLLCSASAPAQRVHPRVLWAGGAAALAGALLLDRTVDAALPDGGGQRLAPVTRVLNYGGRPQLAVPALGGLWAAGQLSGQAPLSRSAVRIGGGLLAAGVANGTLKYGLGRERPSDTDDPMRLRPFNPENRWQAFPSGHATVAFSLATGIAHEARQPLVTAAVFTGAGLVAWSRVYDDKHWTSDAVGGALLGIVATRSAIGAIHRAQRGHARVTFTPLPRGVSLSIPVD